MVKDPIFFTPEVDHSMNIINETDREEHSRMRRMLSFAFSNSNLLENEDVLVRRTNDFIDTLAEVNQNAKSKSKRGFNIVQQFNYVTFNIMGKSKSNMPSFPTKRLYMKDGTLIYLAGEMSFGDSFDKRLEEQPGKSNIQHTSPGAAQCWVWLTVGIQNIDIIGRMLSLTQHT